MAMGWVGVNMNEVGKELTVRIKLVGIKKFKLRAWVALKLLMLTDMICPLEIEIINKAVK
jgi:hypothetical protein